MNEHWTQTHPHLGRFAYRVMRALQYTAVTLLIVGALIIAAVWQ